MLILAQSLDPDTTRHVRRFTAAHNDQHIRSLNTAIIALKNAGIFNKLDCLCLAAINGADTVLNIVDENADSTKVGAIQDSVFYSKYTYGVGYYIESYYHIDTGIKIEAGSNCQIDSNSLFVYTTGNGVSGGCLIGSADDTTSTLSKMRILTGTSAKIQNHDSVQLTAPFTINTGFLGMSRYSPTKVIYAQSANAADISENSNATTAATTTVRIGASSTTSGSEKPATGAYIMCWGVGSEIADTVNGFDTLKDIINEYVSDMLTDVGDGLLLQDPQKATGLWLGAPTDFGTDEGGTIGDGLRLINPQGVSGFVLGTPIILVSPPIPVQPPTINSVVSVGTTSLRVSWTDNQTAPSDSFTIYVEHDATSTVVQTISGVTGSSYDIIGLTQDNLYNISMIAVVGAEQSGVSATVSGTPSTTTVLFFDDFSSGTLNFVSPGQPGWWFAKSGQGGITPHVVSEKYLTGGYSCKFEFPANSPETNDSILSELDFRLGVQTREFWIKFVVRIPDNYEHLPPLAGTNCKVMYVDSNVDDRAGVAFFGMESWWTSEFGTNSGYVIPNFKNGETYQSHAPGRNGVHMPWGATDAPWDSRGKWHEWIVHHKLATPTENPLCEISLNGTEWISLQDTLTGYSAADYFSSGYFMGAQNAPGGNWPTTLIYYLDEFTISTNQITSAGGFPKGD